MDKEHEPIRTILMIVLGMIPAVLQFYSTGDVPALVIVGVASIVISVYFIYDWIKKELGEIKRRVEMLEGNKGTIDPRDVMLVIMFILLLLYLRTAGYI